MHVLSGAKVNLSIEYSGGKGSTYTWNYSSDSTTDSELTLAPGENLLENVPNSSDSVDLPNNCNSEITNENLPGPITLSTLNEHLESHTNKISALLEGYLQKYINKDVRPLILNNFS